jgi:hypothetical protein
MSELAPCEFVALRIMPVHWRIMQDHRGIGKIMQNIAGSSRVMQNCVGSCRIQSESCSIMIQERSHYMFQKSSCGFTGTGLYHYTRRQNKRNGHYFSDKFDSAITFFLLSTPMKTLFMAILRQAITANIGK